MSFWNRDFLPALPTSSRWADRALAPLAEMEDMLDRFRREFYSQDLIKGIGEGFTPRVEVRETDKNILVSCEIPGINEKDITVTLKDNNLIVEGEKKIKRKKEDKGYYSSEFSYGSFYRSIPLFEDVDADKVDATFSNGVLEVKLNKLEESKHTGKRIEIRH